MRVGGEPIAGNVVCVAAADSDGAVGDVGGTVPGAGSGAEQLQPGETTWEQSWQKTLVQAMQALVHQQQMDAEPTYFGETADQWLSIAETAGAKIAQKGADAVNGLMEQAAGVINLGIKLNAAVWGVDITFQINVPDWSNGLFAAESPLEHNISKFVGGIVLQSALTAGIGGLLSGLEEASEAANAAESALAAETAAVESEAGGTASGAFNSAGEGSKMCPTDCFVAGTEVITGVNANGTFSQTPIQDVYVGEEVLSQNQFDPSAPPEEEIVTAVQQHTVYQLQIVTVRGSDGKTETISTTPEHPFYVEGNGWANADGLAAGEELEEPDGSYATVISSAAQNDAQGVTVYNFTVNSDHTYFVDQGGGAVWVHNEFCDPGLEDFVNRLKAACPGSVVATNLELANATGTLAEADVITRLAADIEFKSGTGGHAVDIANQVTRWLESTGGRQLVVYGENLSATVLRRLAQRGVETFTDMESLVARLLQ